MKKTIFLVLTLVLFTGVADAEVCTVKLITGDVVKVFNCTGKGFTRLKTRQKTSTPLKHPRELT